MDYVEQRTHGLPRAGSSAFQGDAAILGIGRYLNDNHEVFPGYGRQTKKYELYLMEILKIWEGKPINVSWIQLWEKVAGVPA